jgi:hypothetical protein
MLRGTTLVLAEASTFIRCNGRTRRRLTLSAHRRRSPASSAHGLPDFHQPPALCVRAYCSGSQRSL